LTINFDELRAVLFDMDGVLYRGKTMLPAVGEMLAFLNKRNLPYACITNNSSMSPAQYEAKLSAMGIAMPASRVFTSATVTGSYLRERYAQGSTVFIIGGSGLREALFTDGHFIEVAPAQQPQLVVQGADFNLTYEKLRLACLAIRQGARYIATNPDRTFPSEEGLIPGAGAVTAALVAATDVTPLVVGKPEPTIFLTAAAMLNVNPLQTLVIGDRLDTDIAGAANAGMASVLVLTGVSLESEARTSDPAPDLICTDMAALLAEWQAH
jgi:4-nitrophenyl phosphatase